MSFIFVLFLSYMSKSYLGFKANEKVPSLASVNMMHTMTIINKLRLTLFNTIQHMIISVKCVFQHLTSDNVNDSHSISVQWESLSRLLAFDSTFNTLWPGCNYNCTVMTLRLLPLMHCSWPYIVETVALDSDTDANPCVPPCIPAIVQQKLSWTYTRCRDPA